MVNRSGINQVNWGEGPVVTLLHGIAASLNDWLELGEVLGENGYRVVAADLPGHGESIKPGRPAQYSASSIFGQTARWLDEIAPPEGIFLLGHSLGGYIALEYARHYPRKVRALILVAPFYTPTQIHPLLLYLNRRPAVSAWALRFTPTWLVQLALGIDPNQRGKLAPNVRKRIAADYKKSSPNITFTASTLTDLSPHLRSITAPTLILWGEKDRTLKPDSFAHLVSMLPRAIGKTKRECAHQPHITHMSWVGGTVLEFLRSQNDTGTGMQANRQSYLTMQPPPG